MAKDQNRREAVEEIRRDRYLHEQRVGKALPDTREIDRWSADVGRRCDRTDHDKPKGR